MPAPHWPPSRAARRTRQQPAADRLAAVRAVAGNGWVPDPPTLPPDEVVAASAAPAAPDPWDVIIGGSRLGERPVPDQMSADESFPDQPSPEQPPGLRPRGRRRQPPAHRPDADTWRLRLAERAPATLRGARWSVPAAAAAALLALTGLVGVAVVVRTAEATPGVPVPTRPAASTSDAPAEDPDGAGGAAATATHGVEVVEAGAAPPGAPGPRPSTGEVVVHVTGKVAEPGLVRLPAGARVDDAVRAVGGTTPEADLAAVNLARPLVDGEQVHVPAPGEAPVPAAAGNAVTAGGAAPGAAGPGAGGAGEVPTGTVDLNAATLADLDGLPGIGPVLAQRILDWRMQNGRFSSVDELGEVSGIGDAVLGRLRPLVRV